MWTGPGSHLFRIPLARERAERGSALMMRWTGFDRRLRFSRLVRSGERR